jgi:acyl-CoA hydrolase
MQWIDETAAMAAKRHAHRPIITASFNNLQFLRGAYPGDTVVLKAKIVYAGHTSMDVKVETYAETVTGEQFLINCAYATEVAVGEDGKPTIVPELIIETEEEQYEWDRSVLRRELRKKHG